MENNSNITKTRSDVFWIVFVLASSYFFPSLIIDIGFALKPFMYVTIIVFILNLNVIKLSKIQNFEIIMLLFYLYYTFTIIISAFPFSSLRLFLGVYINLFSYFVLRDRLIRITKKELDKIISLVGIMYNVGSLIYYGIALVTVGFNSNMFLGDVYGALIDGGMIRLIGLHYDPNFFVLSNLLFFFFFLTRKNIPFSRLGLVSTTMTMILTISRSGYVIIIFGVLIYFLLIGNVNKLKLLITFIVLVLLVLFLINVFDYNQVFTLIETRFKFSETDASGGRFVLWERGLNLLKLSPIFGLGLYTSGDYMNLYFGEYKHFHNTYLDILIESGIIGIVLFSGFLFTIIKSAITLITDEENIYIVLTIITSFMMIFTLSAITHEFLFFNIAVFATCFINSNLMKENGELIEKNLY